VMHVSLDGASAEVYESIRLRARYDKVLRNLRRLQAAKLRLASTLPEVRIVCVAMRGNLEELPELVRLAHAQGVDSVSVQHLCHDFSESSLPPRYATMRDFIERQTLLNDDPQRVEHYFSLARATAAQLGIALRLPAIRPKQHPPGTPGRARCDWPWRGAYVSYDGRAMPCCMVATPDRASFGNMLHDGVDEVWNSDAYQDFRARLASGTPPEICRGCAVYAGTF
jgi:radical SAM protein with 4Fe4S-binding SPASM domain